MWNQMDWMELRLKFRLSGVYWDIDSILKKGKSKNWLEWIELQIILYHSSQILCNSEFILVKSNLLMWIQRDQCYITMRCDFAMTTCNPCFNSFNLFRSIPPMLKTGTSSIEWIDTIQNSLLLLKISNLGSYEEPLLS